VVRPWQAAALVRDGIVDIPDHHVVRNLRAREGIFLRSDPNETPSDNLIRRRLRARFTARTKTLVSVNAPGTAGPTGWPTSDRRSRCQVPCT
jgi:hypothetical protein